jgi:hypothetical protein
MKTESDRLVVVYQHARGSVRQRVQKVWTTLTEQKESFACTSYESGTVAMLLFSKTPQRVEMVRDCFFRLLGMHAKNRIYHGNFPEQ